MTTASSTTSDPRSAPRARTGIAIRYRLGRAWRYRHLPGYLWHHKRLFGVNNTKFDITYCVFLESFLGDQYGIKAFLDRQKSLNTLTFIDVGRNHGLVFYYAMHHIMQRDLPVKIINYYGIDPSPLKFVYFNFHEYLRRKGININYHLIDRAVVFDGEAGIALRYGENNFGNFHIAGSNYEAGARHKQNRFEYVDINVETMQFAEIKAIIARHSDSDAIIIKYDCKNRTDHMFAETLDLLAELPIAYALAAEHDGSSRRDLSGYRAPGAQVLRASRIT